MILHGRNSKRHRKIPEMTAAAVKKAEAPVLSERLKNSIIVLVSTVWGISMLLSYVQPDKYPPRPEVNGLFSLVVAAVLVTKKKEEDKE